MTVQDDSAEGLTSFSVIARPKGPIVRLLFGDSICGLQFQLQRYLADGRKKYFTVPLHVLDELIVQLQAMRDAAARKYGDGAMAPRTSAVVHRTRTPVGGGAE